MAAIGGTNPKNGNIQLNKDTTPIIKLVIDKGKADLVWTICLNGGFAITAGWLVVGAGTTAGTDSTTGTN